MSLWLLGREITKDWRPAASAFDCWQGLPQLRSTRGEKPDYLKMKWDLPAFFPPVPSLSSPISNEAGDGLRLEIALQNTTLGTVGFFFFFLSFSLSLLRPPTPPPPPPDPPHPHPITPLPALPAPNPDPSLFTPLPPAPTARTPPSFTVPSAAPPAPPRRAIMVTLFFPELLNTQSVSLAAFICQSAFTWVTFCRTWNVLGSFLHTRLRAVSHRCSSSLWECH